MKIFRLLAFQLLIVHASLVTFAETEASETGLSQQVLKKYQTFETYHAVWIVESSDPNIPAKAIWEVAFDRKAKRVLFRDKAVSSKTDQVVDSSFLLIVDGKAFNAAMKYGAEIKKRTWPIPDPNHLVYRDVRRAIPFIYPFDLPFCLSENPFMEIVQGDVKRTPDLGKDSDFYPGFEISSSLESETFAQYKIDLDTLMIQAFRFVYPRSPTSPPVFKSDFVEVNKKLPENLFDFEKQLKILEKTLTQ